MSVKWHLTVESVNQVFIYLIGWLSLNVRNTFTSNETMPWPLTSPSGFQSQTVLIGWTVCDSERWSREITIKCRPDFRAGRRRGEGVEDDEHLPAVLNLSSNQNWEPGHISWLRTLVLTAENFMDKLQRQPNSVSHQRIKALNYVWSSDSDVVF